MKIFKYIAFSTITLLGIVSCENPLEEIVYSQLTPDTLLNSEKGITTVINSAYSYAHRSETSACWSAFFLGDFPSGAHWAKGGGIESQLTQLSNFTFDATHPRVKVLWPLYYKSIRDANIVLDNLNNKNFSSEFISSMTAEAKFIRGWSYSELFSLYGPIPIYTSIEDDPVQARATEDKTISQIESDLFEAISSLPDSAPLGKATKGAAMGILTKHYLNTKQWKKAADMANNVINSGNYVLQTKFTDVFAFDNEGNNEMVWALPKLAVSGNKVSWGMQALIFPKNYPLPYSNNAVFAARTYLFDEFIDSFEDGDGRLDAIITDWKDANGTSQAAYGSDLSLPNKFPFDPNSVGWEGGNDVPIVRFADILLSRAEALNELSGPTQESIDLINQVRARANANDFSLGGYNQESLRLAILEERKREFFYEGKLREDLLRHNMFISDAVARGKNAKSHHRIFPIPQTEIDANELLDQNPGY